MDTYEKKYKEALEKAKVYHNDYTKDIMEDIFPELKESEGEKVRKEIINYFQCQIEEEPTRKEIHNKWITWLEKQGLKSNPYSGVSFNYNGNTWGMCARDNGVDILFNKKLIQHISDEKQGEQKPTDTVEPKFHEGDFIKHNKANIICKVISVNSGSYYVENIETSGRIELFNARQNFHLWTIQDAKDGDVLTGKINGHNYILIFKQVKDGWVETHGHYYDSVNGFCIPSQLFCRDYRGSFSSFTLATKEQRDLLFQKMEEAGYEWDAEKKELKKIEQKPIYTVKPKFKVGYWIVDKSGLAQQVLDFRGGIYTCTYNSFTIDCESNYHLWTIQDAKDGDVLKEDSCIFILEKIKSQDTAITHCCLFDDGDFNLSSKICFDVDSTYPATKEQRDTLLKAMADAGYTFDFENKKLKKIEQKPEENKGNIGGISSNSEWCEENEPHKELAESYLAKFDEKFPILPTLKGKQLADYKNFLNKCQQIFRLKYWGIRPIQAKLFEKLSLLWAAWGAEHLQGLGQADGDMDDEILWSDEDERLCQCLIEDQEEALDKVSNNKYGHSEIISDLKEMYHERIDWLKSLKDKVQPQNKWKPSDEQMHVLRNLAEASIGFQHSKTLISLYDDLKKL